MQRVRYLALLTASLLLLTIVPARSDDTTNKPVSGFFKAVVANFSFWDTNHDDTLSIAELDAAIENPANTGSAAAALATLRHASFASNAPPFTLTNIWQLSHDTNSDVRGFYGAMLRRIKNATNRDLFVSGLPQLYTIHQGVMGNCFALAPLGAMVYRDPHEVASWFEVQSNGNVLVKMTAGAVSVPPPTDAELAFASANSHDGIWINLYEKAIGEARNERKPPGKRFDEALDAISKGGTSDQILSYITGHKVSTFALRTARNPDTGAAKMIQLRQKLEFSNSNKLLMVCGTFKPTTPGISPKHAYALLNYNLQTDTVKLWNPHGNSFKPKGPAGLTNGYPMTNGVFTLPLPDMVSQFNLVVFERPETTPLKWPDQWELMAEAGHFDEAATDLASVMESDNSQAVKLYLLTPLLIQTGRLIDYTNQCKSMLNEYEKTSEAFVAERTAKSCLLLAGSLDTNDLARAVALAAHAVDLSRQGDVLNWRLMTRGLAEYRAGRYEDALKTEALCQQAVTKRHIYNADSCEADIHFISAMAHEKLKQSDGASADLKEGIDIVQSKLPKLDSGDLGVSWFDTLMTYIFLHEAQQTVAAASVIAEKP